VPQFENGALQYIIFEIVSNSETDSGWTIKEQPKQSFPTATGPSAAQTTTAYDGHEGLKKANAKIGVNSTLGWGRNINFE
jgi:hypothetical protein